MCSSSHDAGKLYVCAHACQHVRSVLTCMHTSAQKHGIQSYVPSVFPHDLYPPKDKSSSAEPLFNQLCLVEEAFQQKRKKDLN